MPGGFLDRLGKILTTPLSFPGQHRTEGPPASPPAEQPVEAAPVVEQPVGQPAATQPDVWSTAPAAPPPDAGSTFEPSPEASQTVTAGGDTVAAPEDVAASAWAPDNVITATPADVVAAPTKSAEELEEERLWGEVDGAWARQDFEEVSRLLDRLRVLEPEDAVEIDEKLASATYNWAAELERQGQAQRALALYQDAQRRNPNLGEAGFAIERLQLQLAQGTTSAAPPAAPAERSYTVQDGDNLSAIAEHFYGSPNEWNRIYEANRDVLDDPDLIQPGQTLRIP